jgi:hypothetical protein
LTLNAKVTRSSGISPLLVFFDATGTTDSSIRANSTAFQDVAYSWSFGDTGTSGTSTWAYGSNAGHNSKNSATGGVAAHLYITGGSDTNYNATVTATDGTNTASCTLGVTAYDPSGSNGFAGAATTCAYNSTLGSGCPAGAKTLQTSSLSTALGSSYFGSNRRVLFKCGDTFSGGSNNQLTTSPGVFHWAIDAYGGCETTQITPSNASTFPNMSGGFNMDLNNTENGSSDHSNSGDGRIANIHCSGTGACFSQTYGGGTVSGTSSSILYLPYQITLYNLYSNASNESFYFSQGSQIGFIQLYQPQMGANQGTYLENGGQNPLNWAACGNLGSTYCPFPNNNYQALMGGYFNGTGSPNTSGSGVETVRVSGGAYFVFENNTFLNGNNVGATLKLNPGLVSNGGGTWAGAYMEYLEISDNLFAGKSGSQIVEFSPQNGVSDERGRYMVFERNVVDATVSGGKVLIGGVNNTVRDNAVIGQGGNPTYAFQIAQRGIEPAPQYVEVYNNSCNAVSVCVGLTGDFYAGPPSNSFAQNNLYYSSSGTAAVANAGTNNTVSNNTANSTMNPAWTNGSGTFDLITDWKPTANYSGGASAPVWYDALGATWPPTWDLGAVHP